MYLVVFFKYFDFATLANLCVYKIVHIASELKISTKLITSSKRILKTFEG